MLGVESFGRSRAIEDEEHRIWQAWSEIMAGRSLKSIRADDYLELYRRTQIDLHVSWP